MLPCHSRSLGSMMAVASGGFLHEAQGESLVTCQSATAGLFQGGALVAQLPVSGVCCSSTLTKASMAPTSLRSTASSAAPASPSSRAHVLAAPCSETHEGHHVVHRSDAASSRTHIPAATCKRTSSLLLFGHLVTPGTSVVLLQHAGVHQAAPYRSCRIVCAWRDGRRCCLSGDVTYSKASKGSLPRAGDAVITGSTGNAHRRSLAAHTARSATHAVRLGGERSSALAKRCAGSRQCVRVRRRGRHNQVAGAKCSKRRLGT